MAAVNKAFQKDILELFDTKIKVKQTGRYNIVTFSAPFTSQMQHAPHMNRFPHQAVWDGEVMNKSVRFSGNLNVRGKRLKENIVRERNLHKKKFI